MGILDITDNFCKTIHQDNINGILTENMKMSNKVHEQPLVSFIEKEEEKQVIYREEL